MTKKVLVVDDELDIIQTIKVGLENEIDDFQVIGLQSGKKCLDFLDRCTDYPDVILIDIIMPEMDGWQVLNRLKENNKLSNIPIVFLTAKTDDFTKTFGKTQTADFIEKPFDINDLKIRIKNVIRKANNDYLSIE